MPTDALRNTHEGEFKIEDARPEDIETTREIVHTRWIELYPNADYGITAEDLAACDFHNKDLIAGRKREIAENFPNVHTWVAKNNGKVVGFCRASRLRGYGHIDAIYLLSGFTGGGLGKKLMDKAFEFFGPKLDIKLEVVSYNKDAIYFYRKLGFKETNQRVPYDPTELPSGKELPRIEMMKAKS